MPSKNLTVRAVQAAAPLSGRRTEYWDEALPGFLLRVSPSGQKTWQVFYRLRGKNRRLTLGTFPVVDVLEAREKARRALNAVQDDRDSGAERAARRQALSFDDLCAQYLEWVSGGLSLSNPPADAVPRRRSWKQKERTLMPVRKAWRHKAAADVARADVRALVNEKAASAGYQANRVLAEIRRVFNFALENDLLAVTPPRTSKRLPKNSRGSGRWPTMRFGAFGVPWIPKKCRLHRCFGWRS